ncbi:MAG: glucose-6-phosphate isomerase [Eubacteriales bacterium]|nr:glucose-6-phosphate isomerase [Eubacteriales bacterium]
MKRQLEFSFSDTGAFVAPRECEEIRVLTEAAFDTLTKRTGAGSDYTGWIDWPVDYDKEEFERILAAAERIKSDSEVLVVIGIGGSYLGARAAIEFLRHGFYNNVPAAIRKTPEIYYAGNNISGRYLAELLDVIGERDFSVNVISKSGTTTEPAIAFRVLRDRLEEKYGKAAAAKRIYATTDANKGALKTVADTEGYETFTVPDDVGGRYSVLTAVGLLPIAVSGADVRALVEGAANMRETLLKKDFDKNIAMQYAAVRNILYRKGYNTEIMVNYEPGLHYFNEWWKQLYGESEGKDQKGIFPAAVDFSTDLHSMGQFIQDGYRNLFETVVLVDESTRNMTVPTAADDSDNLNYLAGRTMDAVNKCAAEAVVAAHVDGGVPNMKVCMPAQDEYSLGQAFYFFEFACGISGYLNGVNPFNQEGVEDYKRNMFALLGKPGYEERRAELEKRCDRKK